MNDLTYTPMTVDDLPDVLKIERDSFVNPWSRPMFERDVLHNKLAHIFTVRRGGLVIGYFSLWKIVDEGHLVTLAVDRSSRGHGLGESILREVVRLAESLNIIRITLEVRETNVDAIRLYLRFGFIKAGVRLKYYEDGTHAWIMDYLLRPGAEAEASA